MDRPFYMLYKNMHDKITVMPCNQHDSIVSSWNGFARVRRIKRVLPSWVFVVNNRG